MDRIARETEGHWPAAAIPREAAPTSALRAHERAVSRAARTLAHEAGASLIVVFTRTGTSAHLVSKERPEAPILAFTPFDVVYQRLALWWGVRARHCALMGSTEALIEAVDLELRTAGLAAESDLIVVVGGMPIAGQARTNFVKLHRVGG
jgi:pyruvate kinase